MNAKMLAASMFCAAAIIGCSQDTGLPTEPKGSATDPPHQSNLPGVMKASFPTKSIRIDETLIDPVDKGELIEIKGIVQYTVRQLPILSRDEVVVDLSFKGEATSSIFDGPAGWPIRGKIEETLNLGWQEFKEIDETYPILGDSEHLSLRVKYVVTNSDVRVESMWLVPRLSK